MSETNGSGPDIVIDLNRITRLEYRQFLTGMAQAGDGEQRDKLTAKLVNKVVVAWPFETPIQDNGYLELGLSDAIAVDEALMEALQMVGKKK